MAHYHSKRGITIVEVLIGLAIFTVLTALVTGALARFFSTSAEAVQEVKALHLVREGHELVRFVRDEDWSDITAESTDTARYLDVTGGAVSFTGTTEVIDTDFTRTVYLREVYRDTSDDLVESTAPGASVDSGSRYIDVTVAWGAESMTTRSLLTNILNQ